MSGGSMDYLYNRVEDANFVEYTPERRAFRQHLNLVAQALHDIEWVDSSDNAKGSENEAILKVLGKERVVEQLVSEAKSIRCQLEEYLISIGEA